ncbi:MAG: DUF2442 domain-containing protein [Acidimicrobiales bacterium]
MAVLARVTKVEHIGARTLRIVFSDGLVRELDFTGALPGVLAALDDDITFATATVDRAAGTVCWPNGLDLDLDPDVLHGDHQSASTPQPRVVREYRLQATG